MTVSTSSPKLPPVVTHHLNQLDRSLASITQSQHQLQTIELQLINSKLLKEREHQPKFAADCQKEYAKVYASYEQFLKLEKRIEQIWENAKKAKTALKGLSDSKVQPYQAESPNHPIQAIKKKIEILDTAILSLEAHTVNLEEEIAQNERETGLKEKVDLFREQILSRKIKFKQIAESISEKHLPRRICTWEDFLEAPKTPRQTDLQSTDTLIGDSIFNLFNEEAPSPSNSNRNPAVRLDFTGISSEEDFPSALPTEIPLPPSPNLSFIETPPAQLDSNRQITFGPPDISTAGIPDKNKEGLKERIDLLRKRILSLKQKIEQTTKSLSNTPTIIETPSKQNSDTRTDSDSPEISTELSILNLTTETSPEENSPLPLPAEELSPSLPNLNSVTKTLSILQQNTIQHASAEEDAFLKLQGLLKLPAIAIPEIRAHLNTAEERQSPKSFSSLPPLHPNTFAGQSSPNKSRTNSPRSSSLEGTRNRSHSNSASPSLITALPSPPASRSSSPSTPDLFTGIEEPTDRSAESRNSNEEPLARLIAPLVGPSPEPTTTENSSRSTSSNTDSSNDRSLASTHTPASSNQNGADLNTPQQVQNASRPDPQKLLRPVFSYLTPAVKSTPTAHKIPLPDLQKLLKPVFSAPVKAAEEPNAKPAIDATNSYPYKTIGLIALVGASALAYKWYSK